IIRTGDIRVNLLDPDVKVRISSAELTQVLLNLMINALQGSGRSQTIEVEARLAQEPIDIAELTREPGTKFLHADVFSNKPPFISIAVKDEAGGIPHDIVDEIFE